MRAVLCCAVAWSGIRSTYCVEVGIPVVNMGIPVAETFRQKK